jgi:tetratricopeptide (TPR) repeat protein
MDVSRRAEENFNTGQRLLWLNRLEVEHDNLRSALGWALESDPGSALRMVDLLAIFWLSRSYLTEGCKWCQSAIARAEALLPVEPSFDSIRGRAYTALAMLSINRGDHQAAQTAARTGAALARQVNDPLQLARALNFLGLSSAFLGDATLAFDALRESETLCREFGYRDELASVLLSLVYVTMEIRGPESAVQLQSYLEESLTLSQGSVDPESAVRTEGILARLAFHRGDLAEARNHADLMLDLHREMGDQLAVTGHQSMMAHIARQMGNYREALDLYRETLPDWQKIGHRGAVAHQLESFAFIASAQEKGERAVKLLGAAEVLREASNSPMTPQERVEYAREVASLRAGMDQKDFDSLWAEGRAMTMEQAIEYARNEDMP